MTDEEMIDEVLRLDAKATGGKWSVYNNPLRRNLSAARIIEVQCDDRLPIVKWAGFDDCERPKAKHLANARLIASYRTDAPELARRLKAANERATLAEASLDELNGHRERMARNYRDALTSLEAQIHSKACAYEDEKRRAEAAEASLAEMREQRDAAQVALAWLDAVDTNKAFRPAMTDEFNQALEAARARATQEKEKEKADGQ